MIVLCGAKFLSRSYLGAKLKPLHYDPNLACIMIKDQGNTPLPSTPVGQHLMRETSGNSPQPVGTSMCVSVC